MAIVGILMERVHMRVKLRKNFRDLTQFVMKVFKVKKGKRSYNRKVKHKETKNAS